MKHKSIISLAGICCLLLSGLSGAAVNRPPSVPVTEVLSVSQTIASNGDPVDIYFPGPGGSAAGHRFPVVVYLQGARVDKKYYSQFAQQLASYGFIVAVPNHPGLFASSTMITDAFEHIRLEDAVIGSPLNGIVDTNSLIVSGHSLGGAAALSSAVGICFNCVAGEVFVPPPEMKAVVATAGNAGVVDLRNARMPLAMIVGDLNSGQSNYQLSYENMVHPRALMHVHGANHYGMTDIAQPPDAPIRDEESQTIPQSITATRFAYWTGMYLRAWVFYDWLAFWQLISGGDEFVSVTTDYRLPVPGGAVRFPQR